MFIRTKEGPQEEKSDHRLARGVGQKRLLMGLADRQINYYKVCFKVPQMVLENMNKALVSDGVDDQSTTALVDEFKGMAFLGQGQVFIGGMNEDMVTTKLIVAQ